MTTNERLIVLQFLKEHAKILQKSKKQSLNPAFGKLLSRKNMLKILESSWFEQDLAKHQIETLETENIFELIGEDFFVLEFFIHKIESRIHATPSLSQQSANEFFESKGLGMHYLASKPTQSWDKYDLSNYYALLYKRGVTKRVFAIFTSEVKNEDKYVVTTKPTFFFDTEEEAQAELEKIILEKKFERDELKIMSLWHIK